MKSYLGDQFPELEPIRLETISCMIELASKFVRLCDSALAEATSDSYRRDILETKQALEQRLKELKLEWNDQLGEEYPATN